MPEPYSDFPLFKQIQQFIDENQLMRSEDSVLVAISGGPDSVFLAWALHSLGYKISLAHVNYHLRGADSDAEEALVRAYAAEWKVPVFVKELSGKDWDAKESDSLQMYARKVRYDFFEKIMQQKAISFCATAHQLDDQVESLLLSLAKGNSFYLFSPIPSKRGPYVRPLLGVKKKAILEVLEEQNLRYSLDFTNAQNRYQRNQIRNEVIPDFQRINSRFSEHLIERFSWYRSQESLLTLLLEELYREFVEVGEGQNFFRLSAFAEGPYKDHQQVFWGYCLMRWGVHGTTFQEALKLLNSSSSKQVFIDSKSILYRTRQGILWEKYLHDTDHYLELTSREELPWERRFLGQLIVVKKNNTVKFDKKNDILSMDRAKIFFPIRFRSWKEGDKMVPLGMKGQKKLSDIFIDKKYDASQKRHAIVVESGGEIIGVSGYRISERVKVDFRTHEILSIQFR
ncbi:MAG: tRNA lysidine(34) synthetase TilS [Bacteroidota bacterium]